MSRSIWKCGLSAFVLILLVACGRPSPVATSTETPEVSPVATPAGTATAQPAATEAVETAVSHGGPVRDHVSFVDNLRAKGLTVDPVGNVEQPFLRAKGTLLRISGGDLRQPAEVQSYDYNDTDFGGNGAAAAESDAQQIGPDGIPRTAMITWVAPPHFFRKERAFVIYVGDDEAVLKVLAEALGPQFAGR